MPSAPLGAPRRASIACSLTTVVILIGGLLAACGSSIALPEASPQAGMNADDSDVIDTGGETGSNMGDMGDIGGDTSSAHATNADAPKFRAPAMSVPVLRVGDFTCVGKIHVAMASAQEGHDPVLTWQNATYAMKLVPTTTGAVRYEDDAKNLVWIQGAEESMLLSNANHRPLAMDCVSASQ